MITIFSVILLAVPVYAWLVYPLLLRMLAPPAEGRPTAEAPSAAPAGLSFDLLLAAHNEEQNIGARIDNLAATCAAVSGCRQIMIGLDGCSDRTAAIAQARLAAHQADIRIISFPQRRGKVAVLKDLVAQSDADVLVFTDANTEFAPDAVSRMLCHFADEQTGGVVGRLVLEKKVARLPVFVPAELPSSLSFAVTSRRGTQGYKVTRQESLLRSSSDAGQAADGSRESGVGSPCHHGCVKNGSAGASPSPRNTNAAEPPESSYWRWETGLKIRESALDSCLGANGAIYAIRRETFWREIPDNTIVDDFVIGMKVREQGRRLLYEPEAVAYEELPPGGAEWRRRVRIGAGDFQALLLCRACLLPHFRWFAWCFWSHKVLRWFTPHITVALLLLSAFAGWRGNVNAIVLAAPAGVALLALSAVVSRRARHLIAMQCALFAGFAVFCRGHLRGTWERTPRG